MLTKVKMKRWRKLIKWRIVNGIAEEWQKKTKKKYIIKWNGIEEIKIEMAA